jgi:prepilin-type processing-associated H-X9-DG protein
MPALARARREAQKTACLSNQKQIGLYFAMYRSDNKNRMPTFRVNGNWSGYDTFGADSSLAIANLYPDYADTHELFMCQAVDHDIRIVNTDVNSAANPSGAPNMINLDGDTDTVEFRFDSNASEFCDPDYIIDPITPANSRTNRAVLGDGPDLDYLRDQVGASFRARDYANHEYGSNILFYDGHAAFLRFGDIYGRLPNPGLESTYTSGGFTYSVPADSDIYADDDFDSNGRYDGDIREDADLGQIVYMNEDGSGSKNLHGQFYAGPAVDQRP